MIFALLFILGLMFVGIGFILNEKNAKYYLSGYNSMKKSEQDKIDIRTYLRFFKKFHLYLGASYFLIGICLAFLPNKLIANLFLVLYPILGYIYFAIKSKASFKKDDSVSE